MATTKKAAAKIAAPMVMSIEPLTVGDQVTVTVKVTNNGDVALENGTLTFDKGDVQAGDGYTQSGAKATITKLEAGKDCTVTCDYTTVDGDKSGLIIKATYECGDVKAEAQTESITVNEAV